MAIVKYPAGDMGDVNEGEERLRKYLEVHLDNDFYLIPNLHLPYKNPKNNQLQILEYDMLVVAPHGIFNIENKDWGGHLDGDDNYWYVNGKERRNPHKTTSWKGRVLNGFLKAFNPAFQRAWIHSMVTLSNPHQTLSNIYGHTADNSFLLGEKLTSFIDNSFNINKSFDQIADIQKAIVDFLVGANESQKVSQKTHILDYEILEVLDQKENYAEYLVKPKAVSSSIRYRIKEFSLGLSNLPLEERTKQQNIIKNQYNALRQIKSNPFILNVDFRIDDESNTFYEITEFQDENTLQSEFPRKTFTDEEKWNIIDNVCEAVHAAHEADVYHRDIAPHNIFLTSSYATLGNFGKSYFFDHHNEGYTVLHSITKEKIGPYHALELLNEDAGRYTDIYSIGILIYRLFIGNLPVKDCIELNKLGGVLPDEKMPSKLNEHLPSWMDDLMRKTIVSNSDDRFDNIDELRLFIKAAKKKQLEDSQVNTQVKTIIQPSYAPYKTVDELEPGNKVGSYTIVESLGRGGFSRVFLVKHSLQSKEYAMKVFNESVDSSSAVKEYTALRQLDHPGIVKFVWNDQLSSGQFYTVMEYIRGEDLSKYTKPDLSLASYDLHRLIDTILSALVQMQSIDVPLFHRDIKPNNILMDKSTNRFVLIDFNVASDESNKDYTGTGPYIAPDLAVSARELNFNSSGDTFAFGTTLYKLVCKEFPWKGGMPIPNVPPKRPDDLNTALSEKFCDFLYKSIQPKQEDRYQSAQEMLHAFSAIQASDILKQQDSVESSTPMDDVSENIVDYINSLYSQSKYGNAGTRARNEVNKLDDLTYTQTKLDKKLVPAILDGNFKLVIITGNAGDGKTALIKNIESQADHTKLNSNNNGSEFKIKGINFKSNYDGSQDEASLDNSAVLDDFFAPFRNTENFESASEGRIIAINEGRLVDFLTVSDQYDSLADVISKYFKFKGNNKLPPGIIIVNLNLRSVTASDDSSSSILRQQIKKLVDKKLWTKCATCSLAPKCFIKYNVDTLSDPAAGDEVTSRLEDIVHAASLKREFHITMRDLRSFLGYMISRDHSCTDVAEAYQAKDNNGYDYFKNFYFNITDHRADDSGNHDRLVELVRRIDIALTPLPGHDRDLYFDDHKSTDFIGFENRSVNLFEDFNKEKTTLAAHELEPEKLLYLRNWHNLFSRHQYFEGDIDYTVRLPYASLGKFNNLLQNPDDKKLIDTTLQALSKAIAMNEGCDKEELFTKELILSSSHVKDPFSKSFRLFDLDQFSLSVRNEATLAEYLEYHPDTLILRHDDHSHIEMNISLDLFEMLSYISQGFTPSVNDIKGQFVELEIFKNLLENLDYNRVIVTSNNQEYFAIEKHHGSKLRLQKIEI